MYIVVPCEHESDGATNPKTANYYTGGSSVCNLILGPEVTNITCLHNLLATASHVAPATCQGSDPSGGELEKYLMNSIKV